VPVVTGFQGWHEGRVVTLARGGTDVTAVAIAVAVGAQRVEFVKDAPGLLSADPKVVPEARAIPEASHGFLSALAAAGAKVIHPEAARLAERSHLPLEFHALEGERALTVIRGDNPGRPLHAVAAAPAENGVVLVTAVTTRPPAERAQLTDSLRKALGDAGLPILDVLPGANGPRFAVPAALAALATRALHTVFLEHPTTTGEHVRRAS
jgi:aspartate kinase